MHEWRFVIILFVGSNAKYQIHSQSPVFHGSNQGYLYILEGMQFYEVSPIGVIGGRQDLLTYSSVDVFSIGEVVIIPYGSRKKTGVIIAEVKKPKFQTKMIEKTTGDIVSPYLLSLARWMSDYYVTRLSVVMQAILPSGIATKRRFAAVPDLPLIQRDDSVHKLTSEQTAAITEIEKSNHITHVLHGITGSGKTRIYQELARKQLGENKSVVVLVPEIALTPQLSAEFQSLHKNVLVLHSKLTPAQRHIHWRTINKSTEPWIIVGPRSALFSPLKEIGLIVIDECHEPSYQQDSQPKYSALRVAHKLAQLHAGAKLLLASATPSIADYYYAELTSTPIIRLTKPTRKRSTTIKIIDQKDRAAFGTNPIFSKRLLELMNKSFVQNEQILLFHNRRGTARMILCADCGWSAQCNYCHLPMRLHHDTNRLQCHVCGIFTVPPKSCPTCRSVNINFQGFGSKRIEIEVQKLFPKAIVARFDRDTKADYQLHKKYQELYDGTIQIIVGTQGIAKGLDLPKLSTVGVVQADSELFIPDFSSSERSFQLTTQVIGRAGRTGIPSNVIIQTLNPDHAAIVYAAQQNYDEFYTHELTERQAEHMPPFAHLLQAKIGYASKSASEKEAKRILTLIKTTFSGVHARGPAPAFHEHKGTQFYQQIVVTAAKRADLVAIAESLPARWQFILDPVNLL